MQIKLRAKDAENERLLKILQEMDLTYTRKLKDALSVQNVRCQSRFRTILRRENCTCVVKAMAVIHSTLELNGLTRWPVVAGYGE